jgi:LysM repeat protein/ribosomal protein L40E
MTERGTSPSVRMKVCPKCGTRVAEGASRCVVCGTELRADAARRSFQPTGQVTLSLPLAIGLLIFFVLLTAGLTFGASRLLGGGAETTVTPTPSVTPTQTNTPEPTFTETPVPTPTLQPPTEYSVVALDTCGGLAFRFGVTVKSIIELNRLGPECILSIGMKILVPMPTSTPPPPPTPTLPPEEATRAACETISYTVQANDTLGAIAQNYAVEMQAILDYNGMPSETVFVGQIMVIPLCKRAPTPGPTPTPTPPPPYPAPNLLLPRDGEPFSLANDTVTLQWASVGELRENERYQVVIEDITEGTGQRRDVAYVTDTKYLVPVSLRPQEATPHVMRWFVVVVRQEGTTARGDPEYVTGGTPSVKRVFTWSGSPASGATPTPQP